MTLLVSRHESLLSLGGDNRRLSLLNTAIVTLLYGSAGFVFDQSDMSAFDVIKLHIEATLSGIGLSGRGTHNI